MIAYTIACVNARTGMLHKQWLTHNTDPLHIRTSAHLPKSQQLTLPLTIVG